MHNHFVEIHDWPSIIEEENSSNSKKHICKESLTDFSFNNILGVFTNEIDGPVSSHDNK